MRFQEHDRAIMRAVRADALEATATGVAHQQP